MDNWILQIENFKYANGYSHAETKTGKKLFN